MGLRVTLIHRGCERGIQLVSLSGSYPGAPQFGNLRGENPVAEDSPLHAHSGIGSRAIGAGTTVHGIGTIFHQPVGQLVSSVSWAPQRGNLRGEDPVAEDHYSMPRGGEGNRGGHLVTHVELGHHTFQVPIMPASQSAPHGIGGTTDHKAGGCLGRMGRGWGWERERGLGFW